MTNETVELENNDSYVRDVHSKALLANDFSAYKSYLAKKRQAKKVEQLQAEFQEVKKKVGEIELVKNDLCEIKSLLKDLLNKCNYT